MAAATYDSDQQILQKIVNSEKRKNFKAKVLKKTMSLQNNVNTPALITKKPPTMSTKRLFPVTHDDLTTCG